METMTKADLREILQNKMASKNKRANGKTVLGKLDTITEIITQHGRDLAAIYTSPEEAIQHLRNHFNSSHALAQHMQAANSLVRTLRPKENYKKPLILWGEALKEAEEDSHASRCKINQLFSDPMGATEKTIQGYVDHACNMMARVNAINMETIIADPAFFRPLLIRSCSAGTESCYISTIMGICKRNPQASCGASSEHNARSKREALSNAPSNPSLANNFVPMREWHEKLQELLSVEDPHATLLASMAVTFLAYACSMPPKRAEVGGICVFMTEPTEEDVARAPNRIIMDRSEMHITEHKTSQHRVHEDGILEDLTPDFMKILRASINKYPRSHLFIDSTAKAYDRPGFSQWVRRTTQGWFGGRAPGVSLLRHAFCTDLDYNKMTGLEREETALRMGHEVKTQDRYRYINMKPIHPAARNDSMSTSI